MTTPPLLADSAGIAAACARLAACDRLALDTEFLRERTYAAELALVQIATRDEVLLLDPLAGGDLDPLARLLGAPDTVKVLHAARQDVEVLLPLIGLPLPRVLDTQVAAGLLGLPPQIGYAELVSRTLGTTLAKAQGANLARTDWTRRPLSAAQLEYAADDVRHLLPLADALLAQLEERGRRAWLEEECRALCDPALYRYPPELAWQRLKGIEVLAPREQLRLRALAAWREARAQRRNLPRAWVLNDEGLRQLARDPPRDALEIRTRGLFREDTATRLAPEILAALAEAAAADAASVVQRADGRPSPAEQALAQRLSACLREVAAALSLSPEVLATQRDLRRLARGEQDVPPLGGWRRIVIGEPLLAARAKA